MKQKLKLIAMKTLKVIKVIFSNIGKGFVYTITNIIKDFKGEL